MKKKTSKAAGKKTGARRAAKLAPVKPSKTARKTAAAKPAKASPKETLAGKKGAAAAVSATAPANDGKLTFNHAMIYCKDVERGVGFYRDLMGFKLIEDFRYEGKSVYARLRAPGGDGTIALHQAGPGASLASEGVRLYFEVRDLDEFCRKLMQKGFYITQMPRMMPWGWRHAYLNDPDGHEISLYWAGENRMKKTVMQAARAAAKG
ncbi:MAG TPA: VOC family protein [Terriglobales bacterium]|jgi:catechol 2,3-dioxygenase-like lactoylglutathione lyase family enzyme